MMARGSVAPGGADQILRAPFLEDETLELDLQLGDYNWAKLPLTFNALAAMLKGKSTELELMTTLQQQVGTWLEVRVGLGLG